MFIMRPTLFLLMAKVLITKDVEMFIPESVSIKNDSEDSDES